MRTVQFMPYGTDPLAAAKVARRAAAITGGVVMPPVFIGTETQGFWKTRPLWQRGPITHIGGGSEAWRRQKGNVLCCAPLIWK